MSWRTGVFLILFCVCNYIAFHISKIFTHCVKGFSGVGIGCFQFWGGDRGDVLVLVIVIICLVTAHFRSCVPIYLFIGALGRVGISSYDT